ncbi:hypothetical protein CVIRNUC_003543 [Coccomyxa viridis]|uniref:DM2 domain-containing protein n=1 Tax=Coccomyxa viridis TaxID=1274662 RepID=A0AAV1HZR8_9CHLO|nr:hypothetical protein CVIRNUC_003543 [Coccomyxa viridis]
MPSVTTKSPRRSATAKTPKQLDHDKDVPQPGPVAAAESDAQPDTQIEDTTTPDTCATAGCRSMDALVVAMTEAFRDAEQKIRLGKALMKKMQAAHKREVRIALATLKKSKNKKDGAPRQPSGITMPTTISAELADFCGITPGTKIPRTEVTKILLKYVKTNNLEDPTNHRKIIPDRALAQLLSTQDEAVRGDLDYFSMQHYLAPHFIKTNNNKEVTEI